MKDIKFESCGLENTKKNIYIYIYQPIKLITKAHNSYYLYFEPDKPLRNKIFKSQRPLPCIQGRPKA